MQEGVESSRADAVSVMRQLLHHGQSKDRLMAGVHKHVNSYEPEKQHSLLFQHKTNIPQLNRALPVIEFRYKLSQTKVVSEWKDPWVLPECREDAG